MLTFLRWLLDPPCFRCSVVCQSMEIGDPATTASQTFNDCDISHNYVNGILDIKMTNVNQQIRNIISSNFVTNDFKFLSSLGDNTFVGNWVGGNMLLTSNGGFSQYEFTNNTLDSNNVILDLIVQTRNSNKDINRRNTIVSNHVGNDFKFEATIMESTFSGNTIDGSLILSNTGGESQVPDFSNNSIVNNRINKGLNNPTGLLIQADPLNGGSINCDYSHNRIGGNAEFPGSHSYK